MFRRFYCSNLECELPVLDEGEAHHAIHVLRLSVGDQVELFDGYGQTRSGTIAAVSRRSVEIDASKVVKHKQPDRGTLTVACSVPKGDRMKMLVEKLTEIGVDQLIPLQTERSVIDPRKSKLDKLAQTVIGAARQSRRNWIMEISPPENLGSVLQHAGETGTRIVITHPSESTQSVNSLSGDNRDVVLLIGPEGGFTETEVLQARNAGATCMSWSGSILRTETAAIVFATLILKELKGKP